MVARRPAAGSIPRPYIAIGASMALIAVVGFWPTYLGPLFAGVVQKPSVIHFHAIVYFGWLALFVIQAALAAKRRIALHQKVGRIGIAYGTAMIAVGLLATFSQFAARVEAGNLEQAQRALLFPLTDMFIFPPFFFAAVAYRRRPELHKRLMIVASTYLLIAAVLRMPILGDPRSDVLFIGIWLVPIALGMAHDLITRRIVHPVYVIGAIVLTISGFRDVIATTQAWDAFTRWLAAIMT